MAGIAQTGRHTLFSMLSLKSEKKMRERLNKEKKHDTG